MNAWRRSLGATILLLGACRAESPVAPEEQLPSWLTAHIRQLASQPLANPPASILRYDYRGQVVYYVPPRCCDVFGDLFRSDGTLMCHPDGGFAGTGDGRCADFAAERRNEHVIWRDPRAQQE